MLNKIVLTGAAGNLGTQLRGPLSKMAKTLVSTDIAEDLGALNDNETYVKADLASFDAVSALLDGADMVVHFGAIVAEVPFDQMLGPNFVGSYNVWEAGYRHGVRRIVYASSIHAVGMYPKWERITPSSDHAPDTFYGLAKCFTEDLARMYWDKRGMEAVCLRILSCTAKPNNARALGSWLSYPDLVRLVSRSVDTPITGFTVVYGVSNNDRSPVDNSASAHLGYVPQDNAEDYAAEILAKAPVADLTDLGQTHHGGPFASTPLGESDMSQFGIKPKT